MPRRALRGTAGMVFHVMNRSANRLVLFSASSDYQAFMKVMVEAGARVPVQLLVYCLMPNHWHLVIWSRMEGDISRYLQWLTMTHAQRWRRAGGSVGRGAVYQGRFRWVPVQTDVHMLRVCRYVERNPVRADLVVRAEQWPWSSLAAEPRNNCTPPELGEWPILRPANWLEFVNEDDPPSELQRVRRCVARGVPYGSLNWQESTARSLGISLTGPGRRNRGNRGREGFDTPKPLPTLFPH